MTREPVARTRLLCLVEPAVRGDRPKHSPADNGTRVAGPAGCERSLLANGNGPTAPSPLARGARPATIPAHPTHFPHRPQRAEATKSRPRLGDARALPSPPAVLDSASTPGARPRSQGICRRRRTSWCLGSVATCAAPPRPLPRVDRDERHRDGQGVEAEVVRDTTWDRSSSRHGFTPLGAKPPVAEARAESRRTGLAREAPWRDAGSRRPSRGEAGRDGVARAEWSGRTRGGGCRTGGRRRLQHRTSSSHATAS